MFMFHIAFTLGLISLAIGSALYMYSAACEGRGSCFAKIVSIVVIVLSIASLACSSYFNIKMMSMFYGMQMQGPPPVMNGAPPAGMMNHKMDMKKQ